MVRNTPLAAEWASPEGAFNLESITPLAAYAAISPKGGEKSCYIVELHLDAEIFPPFGGNYKGVILP